jgi:hypothetical protein
MKMKILQENLTVRVSLHSMLVETSKYPGFLIQDTVLITSKFKI